MVGFMFFLNIHIASLLQSDISFKPSVLRVLSIPGPVEFQTLATEKEFDRVNFSVLTVYYSICPTET